MTRGIRIGTVRGIPLVIDPSWAIVALLVTWGFYLQLLDSHETASPSVLWSTAVIGAAAFFGSVLVHEISHSLVAENLGIPVKRIRLFIFGGVSEIEQEASTPRVEFLVTAAGPLASFVAAGVLYLVYLAVPAPWQVFADMVGLLALINAALGLFNLLPGLPLDGGRLLRAAVWRATRDYERATRVAVAGGRVLGLLLVAGGFSVLLLARAAEGLWYVAIGWFLTVAAGESLQRMRSLRRVRGAVAADVMQPAAGVIPGDSTLEEFADLRPAGGGRSAFPVVVGGRIRGFVGGAELRRIPRRQWSSRRVEDAMTPLEPDDVVDGDQPVEAVLPLLDDRRRLVVVREGRVVGVISPRDLTEWLKVSRG